MRLPFRIALACCALLALLVDFWLFVALVLLFGRALLVGGHRRGVLGNELASAGVGRVQRELPGEAGEASGAVSPYEILPFP